MCSNFRRALDLHDWASANRRQIHTRRAAETILSVQFFTNRPVTPITQQRIVTARFVTTRSAKKLRLNMIAQRPISLKRPVHRRELPLTFDSVLNQLPGLMSCRAQTYFTDSVSASCICQLDRGPLYLGIVQEGQCFIHPGFN